MIEQGYADPAAESFLSKVSVKWSKYQNFGKQKIIIYRLYIIK